MKDEITIEKVKDLLHDLQDEFNDMIGYDWEFLDKKLTEDHFEFANYVLECFIDKLELLINDKLCDKGE